MQYWWIKYFNLFENFQNIVLELIWSKIQKIEKLKEKSVKKCDFVKNLHFFASRVQKSIWSNNLFFFETVVAVGNSRFSASGPLQF